MLDRLRPILAALLALTVPGLGHVVVRRWARALAWHLTIVGGTLALYALYDVDVADPTRSPIELAETLPPEVALPVAVLVALSAVDAYLIGRRTAAAAKRAEAAAEAVRRRAGDGEMGAGDVGDGGIDAGIVGSDDGGIDAGIVDVDDDGRTSVECPHCGKTADPELDFCHWCTEPFPWADEGSS